MQTRLKFDKNPLSGRLLVFQLLSMISFFTFSQETIEFPVKNYDFGTIQEEGGPVEYKFRFVNEGSEPVKIVYVKASCGCTTPAWTKEMVMPGDSGFVQARYNPRNRPGRFRKSLRITTNDPKGNQTLYINGVVKPKPKTPEEQFPVLFGDFRMATQAVNIGKISTEKPVVKEIDIYNYSDAVLVLKAADFETPEHIQVSLKQDSLLSRAVGQLTLVYDPKVKADYGYVSDVVRIKADSSAAMSVMAVIEEFFPEMTAEALDKAPKLEINDRSYDFGKITQGTSIEKEFELTNTGQEKLEFRAIKSNCDCITYEVKNRGIKKGKSQTLKVLLDTSGLRGNQYKSISIFSNDPVNPTQIISIRGKVSVE